MDSTFRRRPWFYPLGEFPPAAIAGATRRGRHIPVLLMTSLFLLLGACSRSEEEDPRFAFLEQTEAGSDGSVSPNRAEELRREIEANEDLVRELVAGMNRTAVLYKLLAEEYIRQEMYEPALIALENAMELQTENAVLYYWAAVASARSAKAHSSDERQDDLVQRALEYYERALGIRPDYKEALYGAAVLLAFELDRAEEAIIYAERLATLETAAIDVQFLLGNVLVRVGRLDEAADVYDRLARAALSKETRSRAEANRDEILREVAR